MKKNRIIAAAIAAAIAIVLSVVAGLEWSEQGCSAIGIGIGIVFYVGSVTAIWSMVDERLKK